MKEASSRAPPTAKATKILLSPISAVKDISVIVDLLSLSGRIVATYGGVEVADLYNIGISTSIKQQTRRRRLASLPGRAAETISIKIQLRST